MEVTQLQRQIDNCTGAEDMTAIALAYLAGTVIRDAVAAEAWLMKAIEQDDPVHSPRAMGIFGRELLGRDRILPQEEIPELRARAARAEGRERAELEALLSLEEKL